MGHKELVKEVYNLMEKQNILLSFLGEFDLAITDALLTLVDRKSGADEDITVKKKLYKIMVESLENLCRHAEIIEGGDAPSMFYLSKSEDHFYVVTGNYIKTDDVEELMMKIELLNSMTKDEVKQRYRDILAQGKISEKGGAGLGIIDMVLKSESKLEYYFFKHNEKYSFYILKVPVKIIGEESSID